MKISKAFKIGISLTTLLIIIGILKAIDVYDKAFRPNIYTPDTEAVTFYIQPDDTWEEIRASILETLTVEEIKDLDWVVKKKAYTQSIKPGKYKIENGITNNSLINMLRSGRQETVWFVLAGRVRSVDAVAERAATVISADKNEIIGLLHNQAFIDSLGFNKQTVLGMFLPNSYQFYWYTTPRDFVLRMKKEYDKFWSGKRTAQAQAIGYTPFEVTALASIVGEETIKEKEMPDIAGVYINRLEKGIRLQADPTVKFALQDFGLRRLRYKHLDVDSPYNTHKYAGLPPGPIGIPNIQAIDAVLDYKKHKYLYFCAKDDFSGYHVFAKTLAQHNKNARKYHKALNQRGIYK